MCRTLFTINLPVARANEWDFITGAAGAGEVEQGWRSSAWGWWHLGTGREQSWVLWAPKEGSALFLPPVGLIIDLVVLGSPGRGER